MTCDYSYHPYCEYAYNNYYGGCCIQYGWLVFLWILFALFWVLICVSWYMRCKRRQRMRQMEMDMMARAGNQPEVVVVNQGQQPYGQQPYGQQPYGQQPGPYTQQQPYQNQVY